MIRITWKSFWANSKKFAFFFLSIIISISVIETLIYISEAASKIPGIESKALEFAYRSELGESLRLVIPCVVFATIIIVVYAVRFYILSRMKDYGMLILLGVKKKDLIFVLLFEYGICFVISCTLGIVCGKGIIYLIQTVLCKYLGKALINSLDITNVYKVSVGISVLMISLSLLIIFVIFQEKGITNIVKKSIIKENRNISKKTLLYLLLGIVIIGVSFLVVQHNPMMIGLAICFLCIGFFVCVCLGFGYILEKFKETKFYFENILKWNNFYYYFNRNKYRIIIQTLLGIIIICYSFLSIRGTLHPRLMPNDFFCVSDSEYNLIEEFENKFGGTNVSFPMVWVNELAGDSWIGMRVSDYNKIYNENKIIKKDEIIIINREEGSQEEDIGRREYFENLDLGKCVNSDEMGAQYEYTFKIKEESIKELIGFSIRGVIVLPDEIVQEVRVKEDYKQTGYILNVESSYAEPATKFVEELRNEGKLEEAFSKEMILQKDEKENMLYILIVIIVSIVCLGFSFFIIWLLIYSELEEKKERVHFFEILGMKSKMQRKIFRREIQFTFQVSTIFSIIFGGLFCETFILSYYGTHGMFSGESAEKVLFCILTIYFFLEEILMLFSDKCLLKLVYYKNK